MTSKQEELSSESKDFPLDNYELLWHGFVERHGCGARDEKWCDEFKGTLKQLAGTRSEFKLRGLLVARLVPGQLNKSLLAKEQPAIVEEYTVLVSKRQFDQGAFANELPEMFERYRAQRLVLE